MTKNTLVGLKADYNHLQDRLSEADYAALQEALRTITRITVGPVPGTAPLTCEASVRFAIEDGTPQPLSASFRTLE